MIFIILYIHVEYEEFKLYNIFYVLFKSIVHDIGVRSGRGG